MIDQNPQQNSVFEIIMQTLPSQANGGDASFVSQVTDDEYREYVEEYWANKAPFTDAQINKIVGAITNLNGAEFSGQLPEGHMCIPVVIPFTDSGLALDANQLNAGEHVVLLIESPDGVTLRGGFTSVPSLVAQKMPPMIRNNGFVIGADRDEFMRDLRGALVSLSGILSGE